MNLKKAIQQLKNQGKAIVWLGKDISIRQARWKPDADEWSILEVLNHLVDEEVLDFKRHLNHILDTPDALWPEISPQKWVKDKKYNQQDLDQTIKKFEAERKKSIEWLKGLGNANWYSSSQLPWGSLSAGDMLASWLAHDLLHIRQLVELRYRLTQSDNDPYKVDYAGKW